MLMVTAAPSQITFSNAAACRGDGYEGKSKPTTSLMQTLMLRRVCLQRADQLSVLCLCPCILSQVQIKDFIGMLAPLSSSSGP